MSRAIIGYVVQVDSGRVTLNLQENYRGQVASHFEGISPVGEVGSILVIDGGSKLFILKVISIHFSEPRELHSQNKKIGSGTAPPLRQLSGTILGVLHGNKFHPDSMSSPPLGAQAFPITESEMRIIVGSVDSTTTELGTEYRSGIIINANINKLLAQHVAVLGSSGQGKSCFTAAILQQLASHRNSRIVIFDINGEYDRAFKKSEAALRAGDLEYRLPNDSYKQTVLGNGQAEFKIPYFALGRAGLSRLLLPSEKTQRPALSFAVNNLSKVRWNNEKAGVAINDEDPILFDDCRPGDAAQAQRAIDMLREGQVDVQPYWPNMSALGPLIAESYSINRNNKGGFERNGFQYSNVSPLVNRLHRLLEDHRFTSVVNTSSQENRGSKTIEDESKALVDQIFGNMESEWRVHVVNLKNVPQDLMPLILGSLLELYAQVLFQRGQGNSKPTLLVLEEAHHYLRPTPDGDSEASSLAYERLAKEGRKFGLSLWLSTQRPSEVSPTVLSQCNTWVCFKLTSEKDLRVIASGSEWSDKKDISRITGLAREHAMILGGAVNIPTFVRAPIADPTPDSQDGQFDTWI